MVKAIAAVLIITMMGAGNTARPILRTANAARKVEITQ